MPRTTTSVWLTVTAALILIEPAHAAQQTPEVAETARHILSERCFRCHGANGVAAENIFVLDRERLLATGVIIAGDPDSRLLRMVETGAMPMGGPPLSAEDQNALRNWILAGAAAWTAAAPARRRFISEPALLVMIQSDLESLAPADRVNSRYLSLAHLANSGTPDDELERYRIALGKLVNSLSWNRRMTRPQPIDPDRVLFRVDLRDYDWTTETWRTILEAYPYGVVRPEAKAIRSLSGETVPYVRADWFVAAASVPPLYHEILRLPMPKELEGDAR